MDKRIVPSSEPIVSLLQRSSLVLFTCVEFSFHDLKSEALTIMLGKQRCMLSHIVESRPSK